MRLSRSRFHPSSLVIKVGKASLKAVLTIAMLTNLGQTSMAQKFFKCKDSAGHVEFSDRACKDLDHAVQIVPKTPAFNPELKAQNDAQIERDKILVDQLATQRNIRSQAGYAGQDSQVQAAKSLAERMDKDRSRLNAETVSKLPDPPPNPLLTTFP